jgi:hypothetical protein
MKWHEVESACGTHGRDEKFLNKTLTGKLEENESNGKGRLKSDAMAKRVLKIR